jgi:SAM-dependent methyltransferase
VVAVHAARTAEREARFLLPHLRPGLRLLDAGCGPGSITIGLAAAVAPGEVVGLDITAAVLEQARQRATAAGLRNVRFERGSVLSLPFADSSFDVAFAHTLLEHVGDRQAALSELYRVVRPSGLIALRDVDWHALSLAPADPAVETAAALYERVWRANGGHPRCGPELPTLLLEAGCELLATSASFRWDGSADETREFASLLADRLSQPPMADTLVSRGWATFEQLQTLAAACRAWAERRGAFAAMPMVEAIGRRPVP